MMNIWPHDHRVHKKMAASMLTPRARPGARNLLHGLRGVQPAKTNKSTDLYDGRCESPLIANSNTCMRAWKVHCAVPAIGLVAVCGGLGRIRRVMNTEFSDQANLVDWLLMSAIELFDDHSSVTHSKLN
jgi:hypothetical protein